MPEHFRNIDGWFTFPGLYAQMVRVAENGAHFVEVGAWLGKSACFMAEAIKESGKRIRFDAVDTWKGSPSEPVHREVVARHGGSVFRAFLENLSTAGVLDFVTPVASTSLDAVKLYPDESLDFVFIDAEHRDHGCLQDIRAWYPKVKPGGTIAGHDISFPEVRADVEEALGQDFEVDGREDVWIHRKSR